MSTDYDAIRVRVYRELAENDITYSAIYRGEKKAALGGSQPMDKWEITLTRGAVSVEFDYFTGIGLREAATENDKRRARNELYWLTQNDIDRRTHYGRRYLAMVESFRKPKAPHPADFLHCVILDSSASGQSFESWCSEFGYDTDSRKAHATYLACQQNADKLSRVIPADTLRIIGELLQDY